MYRLTALAILLCCSAIAQTPGPQTKVSNSSPSQPDLASNDIVIEKMSEKISFETDGTHTFTEYQRVRVQSEAGVQSYGTIMVPFTANDEVQFDYVKVHKPDGKVIDVGFGDMQEVPAPITQQAPMYSDLRLKHLPVPNLRPGDVLEFQSTTKNVHPLIPNQFWFQYKYSRNFVVLDSSLEASWPTSRTVTVRVNDKLKTEIAESSGRKSYTIHYQNLTVPDSRKKKAGDSAKETENSDPEAESQPDISLTSFASWKELATFFDQIFSERAKANDEITAKALALVKGRTTDDDQIDAIYRYVAQEYRYIGISLGIGRYQPHAAEAVFTNHFGDCKDKHTLLATMLTAAGFKAYPLLINGSGQKLNSQIPAPSQFDHVITVVDRGGKWQFLDSTPELAPAGELMAGIRGSKALLIGGDHKGDILETPKDPPFPLHREMSIEAEVNDIGKITAKIHHSFRDDSEAFLRQAFNDTPRSKWTELAQQLSYSMSYAGDVENAIVNDPQKLSEPFAFSYDYSREDYVTWNGRVGEVKLPLAPIMNTSGADDAPNSKPFQLGSPVDVRLSATVVFPKSALAMPPTPIDIVRDFGEYHSSYKIENHTLTIVRTLKLKQREVSASDLENYRAFCRAIAHDYDESLRVFRSPDSTLKASASSTADELATAAEQALERKDFNSARALAEQLVEKKPDTTTGWAMLADAEMSTMNLENAIQHYRKQLEINPQHDKAVVSLGMALSIIGKHEDAIATLQQYLKSNPSNQSAHIALAYAYFDAKQYSDAISILPELVKNNAGNSTLELLLAKCYMAVKDKKALSLLQSIMSEEKMDGNSIAYTMAEYEFELPTALKWALENSTSLEARSQNDDVVHYTSEPPRSYENISAVWDTIGYIYFLQGDYKHAVDYLEGAWTLEPDRVVGGHLANAYSKSGDLKSEQHIRKLLPGTPESPQSPAEAYSIAQKGAAFTADADVVDELQQMRTIHLPEKSKEFHSAEYVIAIDKTGHANDVVLASGSDIPKSLIRSLKTVTYPIHIPTGTDAKIIRRGTLSCSAYTGCMFVLQQNQKIAKIKVIKLPTPKSPQRKSGE